MADWNGTNIGDEIEDSGGTFTPTSVLAYKGRSPVHNKK